MGLEPTRIGTGPAPEEAAGNWPAAKQRAPQASGASGPSGAAEKGHQCPRRRAVVRDTGNILLTCKGGRASCKGAPLTPPHPRLPHLKARAHRPLGWRALPDPSQSVTSPTREDLQGSSWPLSHAAWHTHHKARPAALRQAAAGQPGPGPAHVAASGAVPRGPAAPPRAAARPDRQSHSDGFPPRFL